MNFDLQNEKEVESLIEATINAKSVAELVPFTIEAVKKVKARWDEHKIEKEL